MKIFYSFLYSPAQKGPSESKVKPEGHWLLRSPAKARKAQLTSLLKHRHLLPVSASTPSIAFPGKMSRRRNNEKKKNMVLETNKNGELHVFSTKS